MSRVRTHTHSLRWFATLWTLAAMLISTRGAAGSNRESDAPRGPLTLSVTDDAPGQDPVGGFISSRLTGVAEPTPPSSCPLCGASTACSCGQLQDLKKKVASAYGETSFLNNFDYLCDPCYTGSNFGESLKRRGVGDCITLDVGGQFRMRQQSERNMRGLGLTGLDDDFLLYRTRLYTNVEIGSAARVFAEGIDATSDYEHYPIRAIEENRMDMLNLFGDLRLLHTDDGALWGRVGRQELLYGKQRLVSPLDWANTRRTFEGYKLFWTGDAWNGDLFYTRPVYPNPTQFDTPDYTREFMGAWLTYKKIQNNRLDLYYLGYNNNSNTPNNFNYDTFGANLTGNWEVWLWDLEAAYQSGNYSGQDHHAGMYTVGFGRNFECLKWKPTVWGYYDWASGSDMLGNGFDHLFPLAHTYLGFMDLYGRRNITDANIRLTFSPHDRLKLLCWYHVFHLETIHDVPYSVLMTPYNPGNLPRSTNLGQELDTLVTVSLTTRASLIFGYCQFFAGDYYFRTPGVAYAGDASFFFTQMQFDF